MVVGAIFDLDGTIVKHVSGLRFAKYLIRKKVLSVRLSIFIPSLKSFYNFFAKKVSKYIHDVDLVWGASMKGVKKDVVVKHSNKYAVLELKRVYKKMIKKINFHKEQGHKLILMSASPDELVKAVGELLGFDEAIGTRLIVKNGVYTGRVKKPYLSGKDRVTLMKKLAKKHKINLKKSYAYGNCINDLGVLESVANPVAVNPDRYLKLIAKKKGWQII